MGVKRERVYILPTGRKDRIEGITVDRREEEKNIDAGVSIPPSSSQVPCYICLCLTLFGLSNVELAGMRMK